jgi:hypothetical protein
MPVIADYLDLSAWLPIVEIRRHCAMQNNHWYYAGLTDGLYAKRFRVPWSGRRLTRVWLYRAATLERIEFTEWTEGYDFALQRPDLALQLIKIADEESG